MGNEERKEKFQHLTEECGPHCGAIATISPKQTYVSVGHCNCKEHCHGDKPFIPVTRRN